VWHIHRIETCVSVWCAWSACVGVRQPHTNTVPHVHTHADTHHQHQHLHTQNTYTPLSTHTSKNSAAPHALIFFLFHSLIFFTPRQLKRETYSRRSSKARFEVQLLFQIAIEVFSQNDLRLEFWTLSKFSSQFLLDLGLWESIFFEWCVITNIAIPPHTHSTPHTAQHTPLSVRGVVSAFICIGGSVLFRTEIILRPWFRARTTVISQRHTYYTPHILHICAPVTPLGPKLVPPITTRKIRCPF
jgi:hypothetical protein